MPAFRCARNPCGKANDKAFRVAALANPPSPVYTVIIVEKNGAERRHEFDLDQLTIGRVQGNDLVLPKGNVSKQHCEIERVDANFVVKDRRSTNGTYVNRRRISEPTVVRPGDRVYVGDFIITFEDSAIGAAARSEGDARAHASLEQQGNDEAPSAGVERPVQGSNQRMTALDASPIADRRSPPAVSSQSAQAASGARLSTPPETAPDGRAAIVALATRLCEGVLQHVEPPALEAQITPEIRDAVKSYIDEHAAAVGADTETPDQDVQQAKALATDELLNLGPLASLLDDPAVAEIVVSGAGYLMLFRGQERQEATYPLLLEESAERLAVRLCREEGLEIPEDGSALVRRRLRQRGFDLRLVRCRESGCGALLRLLRVGPITASLDDLVRQGTLSRTMQLFLRHCVAARVNVLVVGQHRAGTGEIMSALSGAVKGERALALLGDTEICGPRGEVRPISPKNKAELAPVLLEASALPRHRVLVDGLGRETGIALLQAISEGADGAFASVRAKTIENGIYRLCAELATLSPAWDVANAADAVVGCFDMAIEVARFRDGRSRVVRICELQRADGPPVAGQDIFKFTVERTSNGGVIEGSFHPTGRSPQFAEELRARGTRMDASLFSRPDR